MNKVGMRLRRARKEANLKQQVAAVELRMDQAELSRIETGNERARMMRIDELARASVLYGKSTDWLLGLSDIPSMRHDLAWRLDQLPPELARVVIEQTIHALHAYLADHGLLKLPSA